MIEIPERMKHLDRDRRGYPVPVIVKRDVKGLPIFAVNDAFRQVRCIEKKLCPICGSRLAKELWFTGGPDSAFHRHGSYIDSAMHYECMEFALQVCPYLAAPNYRGNAVAAMSQLEKRLGEMLTEHSEVNAVRPPLFVSVMAYGQRVVRHSGIGPYWIKPLRPYHAVEFWRHGERLLFENGLQMIKRRADYDIDQCLRLLREAR